MKKFYKKNKKFIGVIFLVLAVLFFIFWEFIGRSELLHDDIAVLRESIDRGTIITEDMVEIIKVDIGRNIDEAVLKKEDILGLEARHYIPAGIQLVKEFFDFPELVLNADEKIMKLPNNWVHSYPETIRRRDKIYIYAVKKEIDEQKNSEISLYKNINDGGLYVFNTTVAYVKDNANREVESLDSDRLVGTAAVSVVEIVITDKQFELLRDYADKGYTFALLYN